MVNNIQNRIDLSKWVIHFVHDRKPEDNLQDLQEIAELEGYNVDVRLPDFYDDAGNSHNILSSIEENAYQLESDAQAFDVLLKILHDGYIHSSWSLRNYIPAIWSKISCMFHGDAPLCFDSVREI